MFKCVLGAKLQRNSLTLALYAIFLKTPFITHTKSIIIPLQLKIDLLWIVINILTSQSGYPEQIVLRKTQL